MATTPRLAALLAATVALGSLAPAPGAPRPEPAGAPQSAAAPHLAGIRGLEGDSRAFQYRLSEPPSGAAAPSGGAALFEIVRAPHRAVELQRLGRGPRPLLDDPLLTDRPAARRSVVLLAQPEGALELEDFLGTLAVVRAGPSDWLYLWGVAVDAGDREERARWGARLRARSAPLSAGLAGGGPGARRSRPAPSAVPEPGTLTGVAGGLLLLTLGAQGLSRKSSGRARSHAAATTCQRSCVRASSKSKR